MKIVLTNGVFDQYNEGFEQFLHFAKKIGNSGSPGGHEGNYLVVAVNDDCSAKAHRGRRAVHWPARVRLDWVRKHPSVDAAILFNGDVPSLVRLIRPHYLVKGGNYAKPLDVAGWRECLDLGGEVRIIRRCPAFERKAHSVAQSLQGGLDYARLTVELTRSSD